MRLLNVCARLVLLLVGYICFTPQSAFAQDGQKYFKITDDGLYYFFNETTIEQNMMANGNNAYSRAITARTFYLEAKKANVIPDGVSFNDFQRMGIAKQKLMLDSVQQNFDWSKYHVENLVQKPDTMVETKEYDIEADTTYKVDNLAFNKEGATLYGDFIIGSTGQKQKFMVYPMAAKNKGVEWIFEWIELDMHLKKQGYKELGLPEIRIYQGLLLKGIDVNTLNALLAQ